MPAANAADRDATSSARGRVTRLRSRARAATASARRGPLRSPAPRTSRGPAAPMPLARAPARRRAAARPRRARRGSPGGTSSASCAVGQQLPGGRRVRRDERRAAGERLEGLVRDHAARLLARAEDAERAAGRLDARPGGPRSRPRAPTRRSPGAAVEQAARAARCRRSGTGPRARAPRRRGSSRARGAGSACRRRARGTARPAASRAGRAGSSAPTKHDLDAVRRQAELARERTRRGPRCRRRRDRPGERRAGRRAGRRPAAGDPRRKRPRSPTSVSWSETSGLNTTGRPRATRFAAGRSK